MSPQPNKQQQWAIDAQGQNVIVSAGAGSGKTMVLTSRAIRLLEAGTPLNQLLVLTFTNAAAMEMKHRIRQRLIALHRHEEASNVDASRIMTFDAFALSLVTKYHYVLGLQPNLSVIDEQLHALIRKKTIAEIFDECYQKRDEDFVRLISNYAVRDDFVLQSFVASIDKLADLKIDKHGYLSSYQRTYFDDAFINQAITTYQNIFDIELDSLLNATNQFFDQSVATSMSNQLLPLRNYTDLTEKIQAINNFKFSRKPSGLLEEDKALHDTIKTQFKLLKTWASVSSSSEIRSRYLETKPSVDTLISLVIELDKRLMEFKHQHQKFSFSDIAKLAIELVKIESVNKELKTEIRHIMIDEYQDTNDIQDYFISLLSSNNTFMVGDIKQSIYRFRNANCDLFSQKYEQYQTGDDGVKIDMNTNFRSRPQVLTAINRLFGRLMTKEIGGADYSKSHNIDFGNVAAYGKIADKDEYGIKVISYQVENNTEAIETEIHLIAKDIINKIQHQFRIHKEDQLQPVSYEDFAILVDRRSSFAIFKRIFHDYGIPLDVTVNDDFHSDNVLNVFKNLVKLVANAKNEQFPNHCLHELMSVWRSFVFDYTDEEVYQKILDIQNHVDDPLIKKLNQIAIEVDFMSLSETLEQIVFTFALHHRLIRLGDVLSNQAKIETMINLAKQFEAIDYTLEQFVTYLDETKLYDESPTFENPSSSGSAVRLMTIHKSKGLEFPIVYYPGLSKQFNRSESKTSFIASGNFGLILPLIDDKNAYTMFHYLARYQEESESLSEELRKLYVALTRAKELMVILFQQKDDKPLISPQKANCFRDFLRYSGLFSDAITTDLLTSIKHIPVKDQMLTMPVKFKTLTLPFTKVASDTASTVITHTTSEALTFGTLLHELMSHLNYADPQLDMIDDLNIKNMIEKTLALPPFSNCKTAVAYPEYSYYDVTTHRIATIDLLLEFDGEIRIIDFKTGNIDQSEYRRQVNIYRRYLQTLTQKRLKLYLISLTNGQYLEVNHEE